MRTEGQPCGRGTMRTEGQQHCCCMDDCFFAIRMLFARRMFFDMRMGGDMRMGLFVVQRYKIKGGSDENYTVNFSES